MVGPSKILTVSYGTFSCTLEGFDEPFDTMKAIAEYFRDLAAEDRYFGAEPPTPDAEMLHKIAEREIKRRVEAKIQDNGVILRPQIEAAEEAPMPRATMHQRPAAPAPVAAAASMVSAPVAAAGLAERDEAGSVSGISAKLQRIRAAVARVRDYEDETEEDAAPAPVALTPEAPLFDEEEVAAAEAEADEARLEAERLAFEDAARLEAERQAFAEAERLEAERLAAEEAARLEAERLAAEEEARLEAERLAAEEEARLEAERLAAEEEARLEAERLAAEEEARLEAERLAAEEAARLEAERLAAEEEARLEAERLAAEEEARLEAERLAAEEAARLEAERLAAEEEARLEAERLAAEEAARLEAERLAAEDAARAAADQAAIEAASLAALERQTIEGQTAEVADAAAADAERERLAAERRKLEDEVRAELAKRDGAAPAERPVRRVVVVRSTPVQPPAQQPAQTAAAPAAADVSAAVRAALAGQSLTADPTPAPAPVPAPVQSTASAFATEGFADEDDEDDTTAPAQAADQDQTDADVIDDDEPLTDDDALQRRVAEALGETGLTADEEAALVAELAAVEREAETARRAESERRALLRGEAADASVDRLISQADSALSGAEAQRRQSTLSHLKAAVVATRAEEEAGAPRDAEQEERDEIARYRADLERSVRRGADEPADEGAPRRPTRPQVQRTERPRNAQPPLVLVSEQRIDKPAETELVRPRRINTGALAMEELFDEDAVATPAPRGKAFGDFVGPMHLTTLAELTEAAAAYVTHVEGLEEFTRPQVMRHVASTGQPMTRSRENLLRTFGLLMRQGTMQRSRRGQFELAPGSEFAEQAKRFAQA
ncbi:hypothetical protein [Pararhodobacter sp.]|uniref:hypothetical protein n=1 Tax=Pararhodobacter sp. TaxID=2127056 RepID=UPI002AFE4A11|nr:hypothetical protein [Pararhodobacter sp.]